MFGVLFYIAVCCAFLRNVGKIFSSPSSTSSNATGYFIVALLYVGWLIANPISALMAGGVGAVGSAVWLIYDACRDNNKTKKESKRQKKRHTQQSSRGTGDWEFIYENDREICYYDPASNRYQYIPKSEKPKIADHSDKDWRPEFTPTQAATLHQAADDVRFSSPDELFYEPDYQDWRYDDMMEGEEDERDW